MVDMEKDWKEYDKTIGALWSQLSRTQKDETMQDYALNGREIPAFMKKVSPRVSFLSSSAIHKRSVRLM